MGMSSIVQSSMRISSSGRRRWGSTGRVGADVRGGEFGGLVVLSEGVAIVGKILTKIV